MTVSRNYVLARKYMNRRVKIKTKFGSTFYGKIVKVNKKQLYLQVSSAKNSKKKAQISFFPFILPLVLFDLLVIGLLESRPYRPYPRPYLNPGSGPYPGSYSNR